MVICLRITEEQHSLLSAVARRERQTIEGWVLRHALGLAEMTADELGLRTDPRKSPRRDEGAVPRPTIITMMNCPHCGIPTRRVATCDNCEKVLS